MAIRPANEGEAADVPAMTHSLPFSSMMYPSCPAAAMATSGTVRIAPLMPLTPFCQLGSAYTTLAPPVEAQSPDPPSSALSFQTFSGM
jgi:hypothetical protein